MTEGLIFLDRSGSFVQWNDAAMCLLGLTADELGGRTPLDPRWQAIHENGDPWPGDSHPVMECLRSGEPVLERLVGVCRSDGTLIWLTVNARPVFDGAGLLIGALGAFRDMTAEIRVRRRAEALERVAVVAAENTPIATAVIDPAGTVLFANPAMSTLLDVAAERLIGSVLASHYVANDAGNGNVAAGEPLERRTDEEVVLASDRVSNRWVRLHVTPLPDVDGHSSTLVQMIDISESRRHLEILSRNEELARVSLDSLDLGVVFASPTLGVQRINRGMTALLGYTGDELFSLWASPSWSMLDADARPIHRPQFAAMQAVDTGEAVRDQILWLRHKAGHWLRTRCCAVPFGWTDEVVITFADITPETPDEAPCPERPLGMSRSARSFPGHPASHHLDALLAALPDSVTIVADDGTIIADRRGVEMDPFPPSTSLIGKTVKHLFGTVTATEFEERVEHLRAGLAVTPFNVIVPASDGMRVIEARIAVLDESHVIVITRDVTDRRAAPDSILLDV